VSDAITVPRAMNESRTYWRRCVRFGSCLAVGLIVIILAPAPANAAEKWRGLFGVDYAWNDVSGSEESYRSQFNLQEGFTLTDFNLSYAGEGRTERFSIDASGFGSAYPTERARVDWRLRSGVDFSFDYDRRESFFGLKESDLRLRSDDWEISRFKAKVEIDSWKPLLVSFTLRSYERDGTVQYPLFGLTRLYPVGNAIDETMTEGSLRLETRSLPIKFEFEQSFARYERKNRRFAAGDTAIGLPDPDLLESTSTDVDHTHEIPTTRLTASYATDRFDGVATFLYADAELDVPGVSQTTFAIGGGAIGTMSFIEDVVGSAQMDSMFGAVNLGFRLGSRWLVRVTAEARDATTDSSLLGRTLVRAMGPPGGEVEFSAAVDETGFYDLHDTEARLRLEYRAPTFSFWAGGLTGSRDVFWKRTSSTRFESSRDSDGFLAGAMWAPGRFLDASLEFEQGDFTRFVFRTDPESVDRATFKLRSHLGRGWQLSAHARYEAATNPDTVAGLDHEASPFGVTASWASKEGESSAALSYEQTDIQTQTGLILPTGEDDVSVYDLDVVSTSLYGQTHAGIFKLHGSATYLTDDGNTWPLESRTAVGRDSLTGPFDIDYGAFVEYWSYDEDLADLDDYDVTRVGVSLLWRFE
jgi:hypothetical protein